MPFLDVRVLVLGVATLPSLPVPDVVTTDGTNTRAAVESVLEASLGPDMAVANTEAGGVSTEMGGVIVVGRVDTALGGVDTVVDGASQRRLFMHHKTSLVT